MAESNFKFYEKSITHLMLDMGYGILMFEFIPYKTVCKLYCWLAEFDFSLTSLFNFLCKSLGIWVITVKLFFFFILSKL